MSQTPRLDALSVLVVDDNRYMCELIGTLLRTFGITRIYLCEDVKRALNTLRTEQIDIVLTDLSMNPVDGLEFTRMLRRDPDSPAPFVPVLMITGHSDRQKVTSARDAGVNEFLVKPLTARALFDRFVSLIDSPRAFIRAGDYMGPDRRRRRAPGFQGPHRRASDNPVSGSALEL
jgi:two-component system, chemotaxis family, chemotaxis protein CheY